MFPCSSAAKGEGSGGCAQVELPGRWKEEEQWVLQHLLVICSQTKGSVQAQRCREFVEAPEQPVPIQEL